LTLTGPFGKRVAMYPRPSPAEEKKRIAYFLNIAKFDKQLGYFVWTKHRPRVRVGERVGNMTTGGYWTLKFRYFGRHIAIFEHRLIWFLHTGEVPDEIDHINGNRLDNRISNIRNVSRHINAKNLSRHRDGRLWGCGWENNGWRARIRNGKKLVHIGRFDTEIEAHRAAIKRAQELGIKTPKHV